MINNLEIAFPIGGNYFLFRGSNPLIWGRTPPSWGESIPSGGKYFQYKVNGNSDRAKEVTQEKSNIKYNK